MRAAAFIPVFACAAQARSVDAGAARRYALERLEVRNIGSGADQLRVELNAEAARFLDFVDSNGRPDLAYFEIGITGS